MQPGETDRLAVVIVGVVLTDLMARRGVGNELEHVEDAYPETWEELKATLVEKVEAVLNASG